MICRLLPHRTLSGPANMALDEALLEKVSEDPSAAILRTYEWTEPTLSLGYFQSIGQVRSEPRWSGVPLVRRATGGGAIWHHHELTYALIVPRDHPRAARAGDLYAAVHEAIRTALAAVGIAAQRRAHSECASDATRPLLCFRDRATDDIVIGQNKVLGSAQRRRPGAVLQHGSLLLRQSDRTPELPGLAELAGNTDAPEQWSARLQNEIVRSLGLAPRAELVTESEWLRASVVESEVYRNPLWTERR